MNKNKIAMCAIIAVAGILILAVLAAISSTNQALAQNKMCALTLNVSPETKGASSYNVNGRLTCGGSGVGGATITFTNVFYGPQPGSTSSNRCK
jgi:hypothetical protein